MSQINLIKGSDLKLKLKKKGVLSVDICNAFNYNKTTVSLYLGDKMQMPASFIIRVAKLGALTIDDLIEGTDKSITYTHADDAQIAAEPVVTYLPAPAPQRDIDVPVLNMSDLLDQVADLRAQLESLEQTINDLKAGKFTVNQ